MTLERTSLSTHLLNGLGLVLLAGICWMVLDWLVFSATPLGAGRAACLDQAGACWPFWQEKLRLMLFGTYPFDQQWRPLVASLLMIGLVVSTGIRLTATQGASQPLLLTAWLTLLPLSTLLMLGGVMGLPSVPTAKLNGLPVLLLLSVGAIALALPIGVSLAMMRVHHASIIMRRAAAISIDGVRAIPMVSVLFVGIFVVPLALPQGTPFDPLWATLVVLVLFHATYVAEDVRGGLLAISHQQIDAAAALGLTPAQTKRLVLRPQAIQHALPALMNTVIGAYKDTSLVLILGLFDLVATARMAFSDPLWQGFALEAYVLVGLWFFVSCSFLSWIGRRLHHSHN